AIAEPAAAQPDVLVLRDSELAARLADVISIRLFVGRDIQRVPNAPAFLLQHPLVIFGITAQRQLERLLRPPREIDELEELVMFAPVIRLPAEMHLPERLRPIADGRETLAVAAAERLP